MPTPPVTSKTKRLLLAGHPNTGKTSIFNLLTQNKKPVGNWSGTTVTTHTDTLQHDDITYEIQDLPGCYTAFSPHNSNPLDEQQAQSCLQQTNADLILFVIDATRIESQMFFALQLIEMQQPILFLLNKMDQVTQHKTIDSEQLADLLNRPVYPMYVHHTTEPKPLFHTIKSALQQTTSAQTKWLEDADLTNFLSNYNDFFKLEEKKGNIFHLLENGTIPEATQHKRKQHQLNRIIKDFVKQFDTDPDTYIADLRYTFIHKLCNKIIIKKENKKMCKKKSFGRIDNWLTHPLFGLVAFFSLMYALFFTAEIIGGILQDFLTAFSTLFFIDGSSHLLTFLHAPDWLSIVLADGFGNGLTTTLSFFPVIFLMFYFMSILEESGYMARITWVMDRHMQRIGLSGHSIVPLLIGFGCNVPAILATRTLKNPYERILTTMMIPFMSCSARLSVYAIFTSAFFPYSGHNIIFLLYLIGMSMAILTALLIQTFFPSSTKSKLTLALPAYQWPKWQTLFSKTHYRTQHFLKRAAKMIIPLVIGLTVLQHLGTSSLNIWLTDANPQHSWMSLIAQWLAPVFHPIGLNADNWPAIVALLVGIIAKEVIVGTLNALYQSPISTPDAIGSWQPMDGLREAWHDVWTHIQHLPHTILHPMESFIQTDTLSPSAYTHLIHHFQTPYAAFAYLLFTLLYFPCISTMTTIADEHNWTLAWASLIWSLLLGYCVSFWFYQTAIGRLSPYSLIVLPLIIVSCINFKRWHKSQSMATA
jgi:ferrous iron transport protein B